MELEELKAAWTTLDRRIEKLEMDHVRPRRRNLSTGPIADLVCGIAGTIWSASLLAGHWNIVMSAPLTALPAGIVILWSLATTALSIIQLDVVGGLDYSAPVGEAQMRLARLRTLRVRSTQFWLLAGLPLWLVFPLFALQSLGGFSAVLQINPGWLAGNLAFGLLAAAGIVAAARVMGPRSPFWQKINDALAGRAIIEAQQDLAEWEDFTLLRDRVRGKID